MQAKISTLRDRIRPVKHGPHRKSRQLVARRLRLLREMRELNQDELAALAGIHRSYIGVIERGEKGVGIDTLGMICDSLGISIQDFFNDEIK